MARGRTARFTIYDVLERKGVFDANTANTSSPQYKKRLYPKLMYHPKGEERITKAAEMVPTIMGPKFCSEQREIINRTVTSEAEEAVARAEGWHDHPAKALKAAGKTVPAVGASDRTADLERQIAELTAERDDLKALKAATDDDE